MADALINSPEFAAANGELTDAEFVDLLYTNLRGPVGAGEDPARDVHLEKLEYGWYRGEIAEIFYDSQEQMNKLDNAAVIFSLSNNPANHSDYVFDMYQALLGRVPDMKGFENWAQSMGDGLDLSSLAENVMGSLEFGARAALGDRDFAMLVLNNLNGGTSGPLDLDTATALLNSGVARSDFVAALVTLSDSAGLTEWMRTEGVDDAIVGGAGTNTLMGGLKSDTFIFAKADASTNTLLDLEPWDFIDLNGFGYTTQAQVRAEMTEAGSNLVFDDQGVQITFLNTTLADIIDDMILI